MLICHAGRISVHLLLVLVTPGPDLTVQPTERINNLEFPDYGADSLQAPAPRL